MITNERNLKMRSPRPAEDRARNYTSQGPLVDSHLQMCTTTAFTHCGKVEHTVRECWMAHLEMKLTGQSRVKFFGCQKIGHLKRDCPEKSLSQSKNNNTDYVVNYSKPRRQKRSNRDPIVDSGCTHPNLNLNPNHGRVMCMYTSISVNVYHS